MTVSQRLPIALDAALACDGGQLLALVGPSGSGKSTLLRMIAGLAQPAAGRIVCGDSVWFDAERNLCLSPQQRRIGHVPQHFGLFPHMSALDNVMAGLHHLGRGQRRRRAEEWLERVHLSGLDERRPAQLSGGEQQRVAVARALARDPAVLLLDEPFSAVDSATREGLYLELAELKQQLSIPVIMVTHDLGEALLLADRMTLLAHGRTLQSGTSRQVMAAPIDEDAARQVGIRNVFDGEILRHDPAAQLTWLRAGPHTLACRQRREFAPGARVRWVIPDSGVRLRSIVHDNLADRSNRLDVTVRALLTLGDEVQVTTVMDGIDAPLRTRIPARLVAGLGLAPQVRTTVVLHQDALHLLGGSDGSDRAGDRQFSDCTRVGPSASHRQGEAREPSGGCS